MLMISSFGEEIKGGVELGVLEESWDWTEDDLAGE